MLNASTIPSGVTVAGVAEWLNQPNRSGFIIARWVVLRGLDWPLKLPAYALRTRPPAIPLLLRSGSHW